MKPNKVHLEQAQQGKLRTDPQSDRLAAPAAKAEFVSKVALGQVNWSGGRLFGGNISAHLATLDWLVAGHNCHARGHKLPVTIESAGWCNRARHAIHPTAGGLV